MTRSLLLVLLAVSATGVLSSSVHALPEVKVSLSREDPDVQTMDVGDAEIVEFFLWMDGMKTRGVEVGVHITGGEFFGYILDESRAWIPFPVANPYPGTVSQVAAGQECFEPPCYFGRVLVKPDKPGDPVHVDVIPSGNEFALMLTCLNQSTTGLYAHPAATNAEAAPAHEVYGVSAGGTEIDMGQVGAPDAEAESENAGSE